MRMEHLTFQIANVTSAILWVPFMLFWGYLFSTIAGDLSTLTVGHWVVLVALIVAMMVGAGTAATRVQSKERQGQAAGGEGTPLRMARAEP